MKDTESDEPWLSIVNGTVNNIIYTLGLSQELNFSAEDEMYRPVNIR